MRRALLLIEHTRNRELLHDWLVALDDDLAPAEEGAVSADLVVADVAGFRRARGRLRELRAREAPAHVPLLLVVPDEQAARVRNEVWQYADDVVTAPVRQGELRLRLERLLAQRARSQAAAHRLSELDRSNTDLQQFAYAAAHELANPLTAVAGAIDTVLGRDRLAAASLELLETAQKQARRMQTLIADLLAFSKVGVNAKPRAVDLDSLIRDARDALAVQIEEAGAVVEVGPCPVVVAAEPQLRLVLSNLVGNALKYGRPGVPPRIRIDCEERERDWLVSVADNGRGIAPDEVDNIFDMFSRAASGDGHGIGLALCRRAIERQGGSIWVEPNEEHGSVFRFSLPKR